MSKYIPKPYPYQETSHEGEIRDVLSSDVEYTEEEGEFLVAMERYQTANNRRFPTYREVLNVLRSLGYRKTEAASEPPKFVKDKGRITRQDKPRA